MVISVAVDCKSDSRQVDLIFYKFPKVINLKQHWFIKKQNVEISSRYMSEFVIHTVSAKISAGKRCDFSWPKIRLCPTPPPLID